MPFFSKIKPDLIEAKQWFPGKKIKGVVGTNPAGDYICMCATPQPEDQVRPHIHPFQATKDHLVEIQPGDWIVVNEGGLRKIKPDVMKEMYIIIVP